jgi:hypothetical protein
MKIFEQTLRFTAEKKHSFRYDAEGLTSNVSTLYISKRALATLVLANGQPPQAITLVVSPTE